ncbi:MAG: CRISPR-associated endonuclease Cas3'', partial [Anaerolineales bacterium]|nr:CRISPR-associated endonuclease Cas3'' [Anaerolineales bacterium]
MIVDSTTATDPPRPCWWQLWAKSGQGGGGGNYHPLWKHLIDAAAVSLALPNPLTRFGWSDTQTALFVGLHDIGKADGAFQRQDADLFKSLPQAYRGTAAGDARCRHERLSARFIRNKLTEAGSDSFTASALARAVLAHHGYWDEAARDVGGAYAKAQDELCCMLEQVLRITGLLTAVPDDLSAFGMRLAGHIVLCDWIASNEKFFTDSRLKGIDDPSAYLVKAKDVASEWPLHLGFERNREAGKPTCIVESARPIQQALLTTDIPPGLVIIEAPMGEG